MRPTTTTIDPRLLPPRWDGRAGRRAALRVRLLALVALPLGVVTVMVLLVAVIGTVSWMWVSSGTV